MLEHRRRGPQKISEQMFCQTKFVSANLPSYTVCALRTTTLQPWVAGGYPMLEHRRRGPQKSSEQMFCQTNFVYANIPNSTV